MYYYTYKVVQYFKAIIVYNFIVLNVPLPCVPLRELRFNSCLLLRSYKHTSVRTRLKAASNNTEDKLKVHSKPTEVKTSNESTRTSLRHSTKESNLKTSPGESKSAKSSPVKNNSNSSKNSSKQVKSVSSNSSSPGNVTTKQAGTNSSTQSGPNLGRLRSYRKREVQEDKSPLKVRLTFYLSVLFLKKHCFASNCFLFVTL